MKLLMTELVVTCNVWYKLPHLLGTSPEQLGVFPKERITLDRGKVNFQPFVCFCSVCCSTNGGEVNVFQQLLQGCSVFAFAVLLQC